MAIELDVYSGKLTYKGIEFDFVFDGAQLRLIPPKSRQQEVIMWNGEKLENGVTRIFPSVRYLEANYLQGTINETGETIIFIPSDSPLGSYQLYIIVIAIRAYAKFNSNDISIDKLSFESKEIDCIFPICHAIESTAWNDDGVISVITKPFDDTTSEKQAFIVDDHNVSVCFGITRNANFISNNKPPLEFHSSMMFEFETTNDFLFIIRLCQIARTFLQYLCYRKDVDFTSITISAPYEGKHRKVSTMFFISEIIEKSDVALSKERYIKQNNIAGYENKILNDIAQDKLYMRHFPESFYSSKHYNAARFVMITAAFEWEFRKQYPDGISKKTKTIEAEKRATETLNELIAQNKGELKSIFKRLRNSVAFTNLESEIIQIGKDYSSIIGVFGDYLYKINDETLEFNKMGHRIAEQRNDFAHGNLDKDILGLSLLDLMFLERIVFAMQLKYWGISNLNIQHIINDLFSARLALPTE